jgi:hypothetical protein
MMRRDRQDVCAPQPGQSSFVPRSLQLQNIMRLLQSLKFSSQIRRRMHNSALGVQLALPGVSAWELIRKAHTANLKFIAARAGNIKLLLKLLLHAAGF